MNNDETLGKRAEPIWPFIAMIVLILALACAYWWGLSAYIPLSGEEASSLRGQFGDMFGGLNALFSGLAFAVLIYTMWLQRKELRLQRVELADTRKELARAAAAQEKAEGALCKQNAALQISAAIEALRARIERYDTQIGAMKELPRNSVLDLPEGPVPATHKIRSMQAEQHALTLELDRLVEKAVTLAREA
jgi:hypothetical protein